MTTLQELQDRGLRPKQLGDKIILIIKPMNDGMKHKNTGSMGSGRHRNV